MLLIKQTPRPFITMGKFGALSILLLSSTARADVILTYLAIGADPSNHSLGAQVTLDIDPAGGLIKATVMNMESDGSGQNVIDDGQLIVGVSIGIDQNLTYIANSLMEGAPDGTVNLSQGVNPPATGSVAPSWNLAFNPGSTTIITFCDNPGAPNCSGSWVGGAGQHQQMIIGSGAGSNGLDYTGANSSLTNSNKNPDIFKTAVFQLSATGLPANLTSANITDVKVYFGTGTFPQSESGVLESGVIPELGPAVLTLAGLMLVGLTRKLRERWR